MKLDKRALERLLTLSDDQLLQVIQKLAAESGINLGAMNIGKGDLARLRAALHGADDGDLERMKQQFGQFGQSGYPGRSAANGRNGTAGMPSDSRKSGADPVNGGGN